MWNLFVSAKHTWTIVLMKSISCGHEMENWPLSHVTVVDQLNWLCILKLTYGQICAPASEIFDCFCNISESIYSWSFCTHCWKLFTIILRFNFQQSFSLALLSGKRATNRFIFWDQTFKTLHVGTYIMYGIHIGSML